MPRSMKPGETIVLRYWPAHEKPPAGWVDVVSMADTHHWRGKIIRKVRDDRTD